MNWTSTKAIMWKGDCDRFRKSGPFMLLDVGPEHEGFIKAFCEKHGMDFDREGTTVTLYPKWRATPRLS